VLEAVGLSEDWRTEEQALQPEHHQSSAIGNGSAGSSSHTVASPLQLHSAEAAEGPHEEIASSAGSADGGDAGVQPIQGVIEVASTEGAGEGSWTGADEGAAETSAADGDVFQGLGELADIEELRGVRVSVDGNGKAIVEYLVHWKVRSFPAL
jgi:hypothetical protein